MRTFARRMRELNMPPPTAMKLQMVSMMICLSVRCQNCAIPHETICSVFASLVILWCLFLYGNQYNRGWQNFAFVLLPSRRIYLSWSAGEWSGWSLHLLPGMRSRYNLFNHFKNKLFSSCLNELHHMRVGSENAPKIKRYFLDAHICAVVRQLVWFWDVHFKETYFDWF